MQRKKRTTKIQFNKSGGASSIHPYNKISRLFEIKCAMHLHAAKVLIRINFELIIDDKYLIILFMCVHSSRHRFGSKRIVVRERRVGRPMCRENSHTTRNTSITHTLYGYTKYIIQLLV